MPATIAIIGPTGVGKSAVAINVARANRGEFVNADKTFIYRGFPISTGLVDVLAAEDVPRHLYQMLDPMEEIFAPGRYADMVRDACGDVRGRRKTAVIEGGSTTYVPAILEANAVDRFIDEIVGIRMPTAAEYRKMLVARLQAAYEQGIVEEIRSGLQHYRHSLIMMTGTAAAPITSFVEGRLSWVEATSACIDGCIMYAQMQMRTFGRFRGITWFDTAAEAEAHLAGRLAPYV